MRFYKEILLYLRSHGSILVKDIFAGANTLIKKPGTLSSIINGIDRLDWYSARKEGLGDIYEGLLEKNAGEKKAGAGQYFTARPLIDSIVAVTKPSVEDVIQDPSAGTGGFLIAASRYILENERPEAWSNQTREKFYRGTFYGMEHVQDTHRLALMNLFLHGLYSADEAVGVRYGDTLAPEGVALPPASLILTHLTQYVCAFRTLV